MILAHPRARPGRLVRAALSASLVTLAIVTLAAPGKAASPTPTVAAAASGLLLPVNGKGYGHHGRSGDARGYTHHRFQHKYAPPRYGHYRYVPRRPFLGSTPHRYSDGGSHFFGLFRAPRSSYRPYTGYYHPYRSYHRH